MHPTKEEMWEELVNSLPAQPTASPPASESPEVTKADTIQEQATAATLSSEEVANLYPQLAAILKSATPTSLSNDDRMRVIGQLRHITKDHGIGQGLVNSWLQPLGMSDEEIEALWDNAPAVNGNVADLESLLVKYADTGAVADAATVAEDTINNEVDSPSGDSERIPAHLQVFVEEKIQAADLTDIPAPIDQTTVIVQRLAGMSSAEQARQIRGSAKVLGITVDELRDKVEAVIALQGSADELSYGVVEPWSDPINPAAVLDEITDTILRYVVLSQEQAWAGALWITMTWFIDYIEVAPIGLIDAPERECGKSKLLEVIGLLVARALQASNSSPSFVFRAIGAWQVTLVVDEGDTHLDGNNELQGIINAGHTRSNAFVGRSVPKDGGFEPKMFSVWGAKAIAGIRMDKHLPESTISRCIVFKLRRKTKAEKVERLRRADHAKFKPLIAKLARFAEDYGYQVQQARPVMPEQLSDRAADNWEPLFAIAACASPEWLQRAEQASLAMSGKTEGSDSLGPEILADVQAIFEAKRELKMRSAELLEALTADAELAWKTYNRNGQPLTVRQLAKLLAGYDIKPRTVRLDKHKTYKGYYRDDFVDAFARYLTPESDPDLRHIAPEALPTEAVAVPDGKTGIRNMPDDPDRTALEAEAEELIDAFQARVAGTSHSSPALSSSGDSDVSGKGGDDEAI